MVFRCRSDVYVWIYVCNRPFLRFTWSVMLSDLTVSRDMTFAAELKLTINYLFRYYAVATWPLTQHYHFPPLLGTTLKFNASQFAMRTFRFRDASCRMKLTTPSCSIIGRSKIQLAMKDKSRFPHMRASGINHISDKPYVTLEGRYFLTWTNRT